MMIYPSLTTIYHKMKKMRRIVVKVKVQKDEADQEFKNNGPESSASIMINLMANFLLFLHLIYLLLKIFLKI